MAAVGRILKPGNGLLFGAQQLSHLFLRQPARLAQGSQLQRDIPGTVGGLEAGAKRRVLKLALQITVEVCPLA